MCLNYANLSGVLGLSVVIMAAAALAAPTPAMPQIVTSSKHTAATFPSTASAFASPSGDTVAVAAKFNLKWTPRSAWQAASVRHITPINEGGGVSHVIIHHTATPGACRSDSSCRAAVRAVQRSHQQDRGWDDIGYNFLIGGGAEHAEIYEGRGFNVSGAHAAGYNGRSVGVVLIGDWSDALPPHSMLAKLKQLITYGVQMGYIQHDYKLLGHRQVKATACPGARLFQEIKQWPHFEESAEKSTR